MKPGQAGFQITGSSSIRPRFCAGGTRLPDNKSADFIIVVPCSWRWVVLSYNLYQAKKQPEVFFTIMSSHGLKIQGK